MTYSTLLEQHSGRSAVPYSGWSDHLHVSQPGSNATEQWQTQLYIFLNAADAGVACWASTWQVG